MRPVGRIGRHEGRVGNDAVHIIADGEALRDAVPVDFQHRHEALRVQLAVAVVLLRPGREIDRALLIFDPLEIQRYSYPVGGR